MPNHLFHRVSNAGPMPVAVRGDGPYIIASDGKRYLDGSGGAAVSCLGHSDKSVRAAIHAQIDAIAFAHTGFFTSEPAEALADRLSKADHPALPVTVADTIETARGCFKAGAGGIHAHVRDADGRHVLDAALYRELLDGLSAAVPGMACQITTEAVGRYAPAEQIALVRAVRPDMVSVALGEMTSEGWNAEAQAFYQWCAMRGIAVQHILYDPADLDLLAAHVAAGEMPSNHLQLLFVLGRYADNQTADPADLDGFIDGLSRHGLDADWAVCAFGRTETEILARALSLGGKVRVGFENNLINRNGATAASNAERVAEIASVAG